MRSPRLVRRAAGSALAALAVVAMSGTQPVQAAPLPSISWWAESTDAMWQVSGTYIPITGQFNNDDFTDILWFSTTGTDQLWLRNVGNGTFTKTQPNIQINGSFTPLVGNFTGNDQINDILWYRAGAATDAMWRGSAAGTFTPLATSINGTYQPRVIPGSSGSDVLWYSPGAASHPVWSYKGTTGVYVTRTATSTAGAQPIPADLNGDGTGDIFWYVPGSGAEKISQGTFENMVSVGGNVAQVSGTYSPQVLRMGNFGGPNIDHILWWSKTSSFMSVWRFDTGFQVTNAPVSMKTSTATTPIRVTTFPGDGLWLWDTAGEDHLWGHKAGGSSFAPTDHGTTDTEIAAGYTPIPLGGNGYPAVQILWYKAGSATERVFTMPI